MSAVVKRVELPEGWKPSGTATFLLGFLTLLSASAGMEVKNPPSESIPMHWITWALSLASIAMGLGASWRRRNGFAFAGICLGVAGGLIATSFSYENYSDLPFLPLTLGAILLIAGGWAARQRTLALLAVAATLLAFAPALMPAGPTTQSQTIGDVTVTLSDTAHIRVATVGNQDVEALYDLDGMRLEASASPLIPLEVSNHVSSFSYASVFPGQRPRRVTIPRWVRNWSAKLTLSRWPATAIDSFQFRAGKMLTQTGHLAQPRFAQWNGDRLEVELAYQPGHVPRLRFQDSKGNTVPSALVRSGGDSVYVLRANPSDKDATFRLDVFSAKQMADSALTFEFRNLPGRQR